jgi:hypothetical protein
MNSYITMSRLAQTEGLGSQMWNFAALYAIARRTGHRIIFLDIWDQGKGLQLAVPFANLPMQVLEVNRLTDEERVATRFDIDTTKIVDSRVFEIEPNVNYDFQGGLFISYRYWYPLLAEIRDAFAFKPEIVRQAQAVLAGVDRQGREVVGLHVRRGDYMTSEYHVNLSMDYYIGACAKFSDERHAFLVFSDDIAWCRQQFARRKNFYYAEPAQPSHYVDLCAMSLCDHNIVANSNFSAWGALLNRNPQKKVVCPVKYFKNDGIIFYVNNAWYPDDWIALDDLLA